MRKGENIRLRNDGRYEARYEKGRKENGSILYGYCYGSTYKEAEDKRNNMISCSFAEKRMNLLILGAGSHGEEVFEIARALRIFDKISFLDDMKTGELIIGKWADVEKYLKEYPLAIAAVGDKLLRRMLHKKLSEIGFIIPALIHPSAIVSQKAVVGPGSVICTSSIVDIGANVGRGCIVSAGATVGRGATLNDWSFLNNGEILLKDKQNTLERKIENNEL